jgi:uncharacterized protein
VTAILVLAKEPRAGRSKTRLTPPLSPAQAARLAAAALETTLAAVRDASVSRKVVVLEGLPGEWLQPGFQLQRQHGGDHARRIANAFADAGAPALLIGMDSPQVTARLLDDAMVALMAPGTDAVLGHAEDGGWWALGLRRADRTVFDGIPMSRDDTGARQHRRLVELGLRTATLPTLRDVDLIEDARAVAAEIPESAFARTLMDVDGLAAAL